MDAFTLVNVALSVGTLGVKVWALGDAVMRPQAGYKVVGKLDKVFWVIILAVSVGAHLALAIPTQFVGGWGGFFGIAGITAALIYLFGVRPGLAELGPRRGGRSSSDGPYGPW
jgi:hypothetical protein